MNKTPSKTKERVVEFFNKGYRVINGECFNPKGTMLTGSLKRNNCKTSYRRISAPYVLFHHLVAYQKFGDEWLYSDLDVRHKDNNSLNNKEDNIVLGTRWENKMDIPIEERKRIMSIARKSDTWKLENAKNVRRRLAKLTDEQVLEIRELLKTDMFLKDIAKIYDVSRSTINDLKFGRTYLTTDPNK